MSDLERLRILIVHWIEHNSEHALTYKEWADKAEALNRKDVSLLLKKIATETEGLNNSFEEVLRLLQGK